MVKTIAALLAALMVLLSVTACSDGSDDSGGSDGPSGPREAVYYGNYTVDGVSYNILTLTGDTTNGDAVFSGANGTLAATYSTSGDRAATDQVMMSRALTFEQGVVLIVALLVYTAVQKLYVKTEQSTISLYDDEGLSHRIGSGIPEKVSGNVVAKYIEFDDDDDDPPQPYYFYSNKTFESTQTDSFGTLSLKGSYTGDPANAGNTVKLSNMRLEYDESMQIWLTIAAGLSGMSVSEYQAQLARAVLTYETREHDGKIYLLGISAEGVPGNDDDDDEKSDVEKWEAGEYNELLVKF